MRYILVLLILIQLKSFSQQSVDAVFIMKTQLYMEKSNVVNIKGFPIKGESSFSFFVKNIELRLDTLASIGFGKDFFFLKLSVQSGIKYNNAILESDSAIMLFIENNCVDYILAINKYSGKSYRLRGFNGNDFYSLYADISRQLVYVGKSKLKMKKFITDYKIESIDSKCLYNSLISDDYDEIKYPCLKSCQGTPTSIR